ncbi:MAG: hypothetical protein KGQ44_01065, partial [Betaproteobacteria bacterium]|nr:hypothetical protein [Betaproteobacteria bacterium]
MIQLNKFFQKEIQLISETSVRFCNPSIIKKDNYWIVLIRGIEENKKIRNRKGFFYNENWIFKYNEQFNLIEKYIIDDNELIENNKECQFGLEDGRIFEWNNELWIIFTGLDIVDNKFINTMCLAQLQDKKLINFKILKSPYNFTREKNWIPLVKNKDLYIIYQSNPIEVYKYERDQLKLV